MGRGTTAPSITTTSDIDSISFRIYSTLSTISDTIATLMVTVTVQQRKKRHSRVRLLSITNASKICSGCSAAASTITITITSTGTSTTTIAYITITNTTSNGKD